MSPSIHPGGDPFIRDHWRALLSGLVWTLLAIVACRGPVPAATPNPALEGTWTYTTAPHGEPCVLYSVESRTSHGYDVTSVGLSCDWSR